MKLVPLVNVVVAKPTVRTEFTDASVYRLVAACDAIKVEVPLARIVTVVVGIVIPETQLLVAPDNAKPCNVP